MKKIDPIFISNEVLLPAHRTLPIQKKKKPFSTCSTHPHTKFYVLPKPDTKTRDHDTSANSKPAMTSPDKIPKKGPASNNKHSFKAGCLHRYMGWFLHIRSLIPFSTGFSPKRWRQETDVIPLKKTQTYSVDKLRTILLYDADSNHETKRIARVEIKMAIEQEKIAGNSSTHPGTNVI